MQWIRWWGMLLLTMLLIACGGGDGDRPRAKTTMLVYLVASDLIASAEGDLTHMLAAASSKDINVVLQVGGGSAAGSVAGVDLTQTVRYRLTPASAPSNGRGWTLERLPQAEQPGAQVAMNKADTLRNFIQWGARQYPAQQYALTLWNHGGGPVAGFGWDEAYGGGKSMSVKDITSAIQQANVRLELLGFDACLMSSLEVAASLQPYVNYLVASEEVTTGWDWTRLVQYMVDNPLARGDALGKTIVDTYKQQNGSLDFTAYAVTDLQQIPALIAVLEKAAASLHQSLQSGGLDTWVQLASARRNAEDFQTNIFNTQFDLVDVLSWVNELAARNLLSHSMQQDIRTAFDRAVIHKDGGEDEAYGLMMYFPRYSTLNSRLLAQYAELDFSAPIKGFVQAYAAFAGSSLMPQITVTSPVLSGNAFSALVSSNMPGLGRVFDRGYAVLTQNGVALAMQQLGVNGNEVRLPQSQVWPHLDGQVITMLPENDEDTVFMIPVRMLDEYGSEADGMLYALQDEQGRLVVKYKLSSQGLAGIGLAMAEIEEDEEFHPLVMNAQGQLVDSGVELIAPEGDWIIEMQAVRGSGYKLYAAASDLVGRLRISPASVDLVTAN